MSNMHEYKEKFLTVYKKLVNISHDYSKDPAEKIYSYDLDDVEAEIQELREICGELKILTNEIDETFIAIVEGNLDRHFEIADLINPLILLMESMLMSDVLPIARVVSPGFKLGCIAQRIERAPSKRTIKVRILVQLLRA